MNWIALKRPGMHIELDLLKIVRGTGHCGRRRYGVGSTVLLLVPYLIEYLIEYLKVLVSDYPVKVL